MAGLSLLADLYAASERGRANTLIVVGQSCGAAAAFVLGGVLLAMSDPESNAWRGAMAWLAAPLIPVLFLMLAMREPPRTERVIENPSMRQAFAEVWRYRALIGPLLLGVALIGIANGAATTWMAPTLSRNFALPPDGIGAIMGIVLLVSGVAGPIAGGMLADLCQRTGGPARTMSVLSVLTLLSVPAAFCALARDVTTLSAVFLVFMTLVGAVIVMGTTLFTIVIPNELRGLCMSLLSAAFLVLGMGLAPLAVSGLSGLLGGSATIGTALALICAGVGVLAAATFAFGRQSLRGKAVTP